MSDLESSSEETITDIWTSQIWNETVFSVQIYATLNKLNPGVKNDIFNLEILRGELVKNIS